MLLSYYDIIEKLIPPIRESRLQRPTLSTPGVLNPWDTLPIKTSRTFGVFSPHDILPINRVYKLLVPIAYKWKSICKGFNLDTARVEALGETDSERLLGLIEHNHHIICQISRLQDILTRIKEDDLARKVMDYLFEPSMIELESNTREIKLELSYLLSGILEHLKGTQLPSDLSELINMLSCYDKTYLRLHDDCIDVDNVISSLIESIRFLDYDFLGFLETLFGPPLSLCSALNYKESLKFYLRRRIFGGGELKTDKEMDLSSYENGTRKLKSVTKELLHIDVWIRPPLTVSDTIIPVCFFRFIWFLAYR